MTQQVPMIIAHRGASQEAPENTLAAFQRAVEQGTDAIELDVYLSKDGEMVVIHDDTINRTTDGRGRVDEMTVAELKQYDAGIKFDESFKGETIPTLEEVYDLIPDDVLVDIEIKVDTNGTLERDLVEFLRHRGRLDCDFVCAYNHRILQRLKQLAPEIKIGLPYIADFVDHLSVLDTFEYPVFSIHPYYRMISAEQIQRVVDNGVNVFTWTVNNEHEMSQLIKSGVSGIITDVPGRMRTLIKELGLA